MGDKFWNDVYITAKPWVIGIVALSLVIGSICRPAGFFEVVSLLKKIFLNILFESDWQNFFSLFFTSVYLSLGLKLWNPIKFPFKWSKTFGLFFLFLALISLCSILKSALIS